MTYYSKLIAAIVGILVLVGSRYGLDLAQHEQVIVDAVIGIVTAVGVYLAKNKPATPEQVKEEAAVLKEAKEELKK